MTGFVLGDLVEGRGLNRTRIAQLLLRLPGKFGDVIGANAHGCSLERVKAKFEFIDGIRVIQAGEICLRCLIEENQHFLF